MSQKPIFQKLLIKPNYKVLLINAPQRYKTQLGNLPANVSLLQENGPADFIQLFVTSQNELESQLQTLKSFLTDKGLLWVTYPKGTSKIETDINRDKIAAYAKTVGLQAVAIVSIDETWSALRLKKA